MAYAPAALPVGWAEGTLDDGTVFFFRKEDPSEVSWERPTVMIFLDSKEFPAVHHVASAAARWWDGAGRRDGSTRNTRAAEADTTAPLDALKQALCHGATVLASVAGGEDCAQATRSAQVQAVVSTFIRGRFEAEERTLADRHDPRCENLERRRHAFLQSTNLKTSRRALRYWSVWTTAQQEERRQEAASSIQQQWRANYSQRHARHTAAAAALPKAGSPYKQLRDLLLKYPELQTGLYAAAASDVSRPWMRAMVGDGRELAYPSGSPQHTERPRRQAARANLRKLERWLLHNSSTREELLELLSDHELRRIALLRKLETCSNEWHESAATVDLSDHIIIAGRPGAAELQEARAAERSAVDHVEKISQIRHRVRERSVHLSASTLAPTISMRQLATPQRLRSSEYDRETSALASSDFTSPVEIQGGGPMVSPPACAAGSEVMRSSRSPSSQVTDNPIAARKAKASKYGLKKNKGLRGRDSRRRQTARRSGQVRIDDLTSDVADGRCASVETIVQQVKLDAIQHRRPIMFAAA